MVTIPRSAEAPAADGGATILRPGFIHGQRQVHLPNNTVLSVPLGLVGKPMEWLLNLDPVHKCVDTVHSMNIPVVGDIFRDLTVSPVSVEALARFAVNAAFDDLYNGVHEIDAIRKGRL